MNDHASNRPFQASPDWWGPRWADGPPGKPPCAGGFLDVLDLIDAGTIDPWVVALLWELIARGSSIIVIAGPSGVGKTTLLTALTDFLPESERLLLVRGAYDPLSFLDDDMFEPQGTTALINEISPHLPIYLWGPGVRRLLTSPRRFRVFATAHASSAQDLVAQLAGYPLQVPLAGIARLDVVVRLDAWRDGANRRRAVTEVTAFDTSERDGIVLRPFLRRVDNLLDREAARAWLGESLERGDEANIETRHNIITSSRRRREEPGEHEPTLRRAFAAAFRRAVGDT